MKLVFLTLALASLGGGTSAQDWSGAYIGVQSANSNYTNETFFNGVFIPPSVDGGGSMTGVFAGYDHQIGNLVVGGEIAFLSGEPALDLFPAITFNDMLDLKARAGFSLGRVLPYAVVGWSRTESINNNNAARVDWDGFAYGIGAEVMVTDQVTAGLEYLQRNLEEDPSVVSPAFNIESDFSTVTFRIGYKF